jgi:hypothetical protein
VTVNPSIMTFNTALVIFNPTVWNTGLGVEESQHGREFGTLKMGGWGNGRGAGKMEVRLRKRRQVWESGREAVKLEVRLRCMQCHETCLDACRHTMRHDACHVLKCSTTHIVSLNVL